MCNKDERFDAVSAPPDSRRTSALDLALTVAERLTSPLGVAHWSAIAARQSGRTVENDGHSIDIAIEVGQAALLFGQLDRTFPDQGWDKIAHDQILYAINVCNEESFSGVPAGLHNGMAGLCFTVNYLSYGGSRYSRLLTELERVLFFQISNILRSVHTPATLAESEYDVITGLAGIGAYLLNRRGSAIASSLLHDIIEYLIAAIRSSPSELPLLVQQSNQFYPEIFPLGQVNCGLAHGVPGVLAFLSIAVLEDVKQDGLLQSVRTLASWLFNRRYQSSYGVDWLTSIVPASASQSNLGPSAPPPAGWCYGAPGIARALWLAGRALEDVQLQDLSIEVIRAVLTRPADILKLPGPGLCHGISGLLNISLRFVRDSPASIAAEKIESLIEQLMNHFNEDHPLGFVDPGPYGGTVDRPGLLQGAGGVALVLLASSSEISPEWDRMFLLS